MSKTLLVGNFGSGNIGDEMILYTGIQKYPDSIIMTADPDFTKVFLMQPDIEVVPFFPAGLRSYMGWAISPAYRQSLKGLKGKIDKIVFVGGGLFAIKHQACVIWAKQIAWMKRQFPHTPIILESQGIDEGLSGSSKKTTLKALEKIDQLTVRDKLSQTAIQNLGLGTPRIVEDPVLTYFKNHKPFFTSEHERKICLINAVAPIDQKLYSRIKKVLKNHDFKFILMDPSDRNNIPVGFEGEEIICRTHEAFIQTFANADAAIGERLHFLIPASQTLGNQKTFALRKPYSEKVSSFCQAQKVKVFTAEG